MNNFTPSSLEDIYTILKNHYEKERMPIVELIHIQTHDPFKVLITTILSSRTKDQTTAQAAYRLFERIKNPTDLDLLPIHELEKLIFPVGFYHVKAQHLKKLPTVLHELYQGMIPKTVEELLKLPGVGRKTANLVVAVAFNQPAICVDTHVHRISNRLGLVCTKKPFETERELEKHLPQQYWSTWNTYVVSFGQSLCNPINPHCNICPMYHHCNRIHVHTIHGK